MATAPSRTLADLAFTVPGIHRVQGSHDVSNLNSTRVAAELKYRRLANRPAVARPAPTGTEGDWLIIREQHLAPAVDVMGLPSQERRASPAGDPHVTRIAAF